MNYLICIPLTGPLVADVVAELVNLIPLGLIYSLLFVVVCGDGFVISCVCCSFSLTIVVDGSFVWITRADDSSNDGTIIGKIVSEFSVVDSVSLLVGAVSVGGIACVALSIAVGRSLSSICED